jgi:hypothetical protein
MSSKPRFPISGMNRRFVSEPAASATTATATATTVTGEVATPLARRGIAISGAGRRLGISGMRRAGVETPTKSSTPDDTNEGLP